MSGIVNRSKTILDICGALGVNPTGLIKLNIILDKDLPRFVVERYVDNEMSEKLTNVLKKCTIPEID